ncbi:MAG: hypothetical protein ACOC1O_02620 [bacterium]
MISWLLNCFLFVIIGFLVGFIMNLFEQQKVNGDVEVERKFLLKYDLTMHDLNFPYIDIEQVYLIDNNFREVRVRKETFYLSDGLVADEIYSIMEKEGEGLSRKENYIYIEKEHYDIIVKNINKTPIIKRRFFDKNKNNNEYKNFYLDVFLNHNSPVDKMVEIEFHSEEDAKKYNSNLSFLGKEVTYDSNYKNKNIFKKINGG